MVSRSAEISWYAAVLALIGALGFAGGMKSKHARGDEMRDKWGIRGVGEAADHSREDSPPMAYGNPDGTPMLFADEAACKVYTRSAAFRDQTAKIRIIMQRMTPPARPHIT